LQHAPEQQQQGCAETDGRVGGGKRDDAGSRGEPVDAVGEELLTKSEAIATIDVPKSGQKTVMLDHLPPAGSVKLFALAAR